MSFTEKIKLMFSSVWGFLEPLVKIFMSSAGQILAVSATKAVLAVSQYAMDNDEDKRRVAFQLIEKDLKQQGIVLGASIINAAIEAAVQKIKK